MKATGFLKWFAVAALLIPVGCGGAASQSPGSGGGKTFTISLSYQAAPSDSDPWHHMAQDWKRLVEQQSKGRITVKLFPGGQLSGGNQQKETELIQNGTIDASIQASSGLTVLDPRFQVVGLPWIVPTQEVADKVIDGPLGQDTLGWIRAKGMEPLSIGTNGFRQLANRKHSVTSPSDLQGLKIRVPGNQVLVAAWKTLGAQPTVVSFAELYTALQQGTVDGEELPFVFKLSTKFYEVEKYATTINYSFDLIYIVVNKSLWTTLDRADQQLLRTTAQQAAKNERQFFTSGDKQVTAQLQSSGMTVTSLSASQLSAFQTKMPAVYEQFSPAIGKDTVAKWQKASA